MRYLVFGVILTGWVVLWWWVYVFHIKDCGNPMQVLLDMNHSGEVYAPLTFKWSDPEPLPGGGFTRWRDSVLTAVGAQDVLYITGLAYRDEGGPLSREELGLFRAKKVANVFEQIGTERIILGSGTGEITADIREKRFPGFTLRVLVRNTFIYELPDRALIYFPYDSVTARYTPEIDTFLMQFAGRIYWTGKGIEVKYAGDVHDSARVSWQISTMYRKLAEAGFPKERISIPDTMITHEETDHGFAPEVEFENRIALIVKT